MRTLEIALTIALFAAAISLMTPSRSSSLGFGSLILLAMILLICQLLFEGYRWQIFPCYFVLIALFIAFRQSISPNASFIFGSVAICCLGGGVLLSTLLPVFGLPTPTGPYKVGTEIRHLTDYNRSEPASANPDDHRELMIQIWYPTTATGRLAPYREKALTGLWNARYTLAKTNSILNAPPLIATHPFPVLFYEPSWWGQRGEATFLSEELASNGYIVVGIDHPYSSSAVSLPGGRIIKTKLSVHETYKTQDSFETFIRTAGDEIRLRAADVEFVFSALEGINAADPERRFTGLLDLSRVGIFGYSLGGGVAAQVCWLDHRFKVGIDLDGMLGAQSEQEGTSAPFLFMLEDITETNFADLGSLKADERREMAFATVQQAEMRRSLAKYGGYSVAIAGVTHGSFSDNLFYSPFSLVNGTGSADTQRVATIIRQYALAFFNSYLTGSPEPLLTDKSPALSGLKVERWVRN